MEVLLTLSRPYKRIISILIDAMFIICAFWLAYFLRLSSLVEFTNQEHWQTVLFLIPFSIYINIKLGLYRAVIRYLSFQALSAIAKAVFLSSVALVILSLVLDSFLPRSIPIIYATFLFVFSAGSRLTLRNWVNKVLQEKKSNILIYGAGSTGRQLIHALQSGKEYNPVAFIDDDKKLQGLTVNGLSVYKKQELKSLISNHNISHVLLAIPRASKKAKALVIDHLEPFSVEVLAVPNMADIVSGKAKIDDLIEVSIEDLLGRDAVPPNPELLKADIDQKVVMVTGAGGSIGSELCRQIILQNPNSIVLFDNSEFNLYQIQQELNNHIRKHHSNIIVHALIGTVQNKTRILQVISSLKVQTLYHAAAYKHVPLVENNVVEGVQNNIFGTLNTAQAAIEANVETFVLISTDKAVRPTNIMGTTKRMAELILQALAKQQHNTRFCMVRFGNVLGSSGSVVPLFKQQIKQGGPITLTHKDINRYFMTIPEAAQLVIQAGAMGMGGDVFLLDMGEPVKIYDLAKNMVQLTGLQVKDEQSPDGDIEILITGLRPGEKLYEELLINKQAQPTGHELIMTANEISLTWQELEPILQELTLACEEYDIEKLSNTLRNAPSGFKPTESSCDIVFLNNQQ
ncbi:nucleoside-diphosphate sugar epimerase/dehydratase [Thalassotalea psychrophila]|uniref:Nucleoside-diphosphate sugar epimerase/dehydratase n=1 Tax=Thalassotalea psychrophila TaxID=3065647 RepID=A0ABY9TSB0_9GAMM|nr:nucleoside-diphosphate sugar epimerase/dehydratase [Colwelliaceae bacterium SQ149]